MNKSLIHDRFAKNLRNYDKTAKVQKRMAERLFSFIKKRSPKKILELGCGTGFLTKLVNEGLEYEKFVAIDIVEDCKTYIQDISSKITFVPTDIEKFIEENSEKYDLIVSNASLQWVEDFEGVIKSLINKLKPNGELVFSTFGPENFKEIYHIMGTSLKYFSQNELQEKFINAEVYPEIHILAFESPKDVLRHLQKTGVNAIENQAWTKKDLIKFENGYRNLCSIRPTLTYNPVYVRIISPVG